MRKYLVLVTGNKGPLPVYRCELGRFALVDKATGSVVEVLEEARPRVEVQLVLELVTSSKMKTVGDQETVVEPSSHPGTKQAHEKWRGASILVVKEPAVVVEPRSHSNSQKNLLDGRVNSRGVGGPSDGSPLARYPE